MILVIIIVLAVTVAAAATAMLTPAHYTLKRTIVVSSPIASVFDFIRFNRNQKRYSKWLSLDPNTTITLKGKEDGTPGAILAFESQNKKAGTGEWETMRIEHNSSIDFELRFFKPFNFTASGQFRTEILSDSKTRIPWIYRGGMKRPMNIMLLFLDMDKLVGNDIKASLEMLKRQLEHHE
jgi:hypothetical protein